MKEKKIDIELMRILAAFAVIFNHTDQGYLLFSCYDSHSLQFWFYLFLSACCEFAVPLFLMIAGSLLLSREPESFSGFLKRKVLRMLLVLTIWSAVYYVVQTAGDLSALSLTDFLRTLYTSRWAGPFWYLYAYLAFLLTVPFLQRIAKALSDKEYLYLFGLVFLFSALLPTAECLLWNGQYHLNSEFDLSWTRAEIFIFPLLGYFAAYRIPDIWNRKRLGLLWLVNLATLVVSCYLTYRNGTESGALLTGSLQRINIDDTFALLNTLTIFATCQYLCRGRKIPQPLKKTILSVGGTTFGIYLLHLLVMQLLENLGIADKIFETLNINYMVRALLYGVLVFAVGCGITQVCRKIPLVKQII